MTLFLVAGHKYLYRKLCIFWQKSLLHIFPNGQHTLENIDEMNKYLNDTCSSLKILFAAECNGALLLISALQRQRQSDLCDFEASLVYMVISRTARAT